MGRKFGTKLTDALHESLLIVLHMVQRAFETNDSFAVDASAMGTRTVLELLIQLIGDILDGQRCHRLKRCGSNMEAKRNLRSRCSSSGHVELCTTWRIHGIGALLTKLETLTVDAINKYLEIKARGMI